MKNETTTKTETIENDQDALFIQRLKELNITKIDGSGICNAIRSIVKQSNGRISQAEVRAILTYNSATNEKLRFYSEVNSGTLSRQYSDAMQELGKRGIGGKRPKALNSLDLSNM